MASLIIGGIIMICSLTIGELPADAKIGMAWAAASCFICAAMLTMAEIVRHLSHRGK